MLTGDGGDNVIDGRDGADTLIGGENPDMGMGDTVSYMYSDRGVTVDLSVTETDGRASGGHAQGDDIDGFENVTGSAHSDVLIGNATANTLKGLAGDDEIIGGDGADTIEGGAGADELDGDNGRVTGQTRSANDTLSYAGSDAGVSVNLAILSVSGGHADGDEIKFDAAVDHDGDEEEEDSTDPIDVSTFENVTGSMHNDRLTGDYRANTLNGLAGDDTLRGGAAADILIGGPGKDTLDGGEEFREKDDMVPIFNDTTGEPVDSDNDGKQDTRVLTALEMDTASYSTAKAGVTVDLSQGKGTGGDAMGDSYPNIELYMGSNNDDTFIASEGADEINAGVHDADDAPNRVTDGDTISYEASETGVIVDLSTPAGIGAANMDSTDGRDENYAEGDSLMGFENVTGSEFRDVLTARADGTDGSVLKGLGGNDDLDGGTGNDTLMGGKGRDTLDGGGGIDRLIGGSGDDVMNGGTDADTYVFSPRDGNGDDVINEFSLTEDMIDLTAFGITDAEELAAVIDVHDGEVRVDLTSFGGGKIILGDVTDVDLLDTTAASVEEDMVDFAEGDTGFDTGIFIL